MKTLKDQIIEALNTSNKSSYSCHPKTRSELKEIIDDRISKEGPDCDLNDIDTSHITDMSHLFDRSDFNGDISEWEVSNVMDMSFMFWNSKFNQPIGDWNVSNVKNMYRMFEKSEFNQDISQWDINKYCNTKDIFYNCPIKEEYKPAL